MLSRSTQSGAKMMATARKLRACGRSVGTATMMPSSAARQTTQFSNLLTKRRLNELNLTSMMQKEYVRRQMYCAGGSMSSIEIQDQTSIVENKLEQEESGMNMVNDFEKSSVANNYLTDDDIRMRVRFHQTMQNVRRRVSIATSPSQNYQNSIIYNQRHILNDSHAQYRSFSTTKTQSSEKTIEDKTKAPVDQPSTTPSSSSKDLSPKPAGEKEKSVGAKVQAAMSSAISALISVLKKTPGILYFYMTHPKEFKEKLLELKDAAKKEANHYYMGSKLLLADVRTAKQMLGRTLEGTPLTRRERKQLLRTVTDVFRLVPMSVFVLIPFMEFALPFALKIFPNMLPSTFQDSLKAEENMKRELKSRIAMAEFFQETLQDLARLQKKAASKRKAAIKENDGPSSDLESSESQEETAESFLKFIEKARKGEMFPPEVIIRYSTYFKDELTLDNMPRMQLINMCKYMNIPPYGSDNLLRFQLRHKIRVLQEDDQKIIWEGLDSLTKMELREACQERGMRSTGLSKDAYIRSLQQWIDLSVNRNVPISLLIMSRTFFLNEEISGKTAADTDGSKSVAGLADAISGLDKEVVNEVILETATSEDKQSEDMIKLKLEVLQQQNELIEEEKQQREAESAQKALKEQMEMEAKSESEQKKVEAEEAKTLEKEAKPEISTGDEASKDIKTTTQITDVPSEVPVSEKVKSSDELIEDVTIGEKEGEEEVEEEEEQKLSSEEMDAISQLVSPDPVSAEREKLERLKKAIKEEDELDEEEIILEDEQTAVDEPAEEIGKESTEPITKTKPDDVDPTTVEPISSEDLDEKVAQKITAEEEAAAHEADASTVFSADGKVAEVVEEEASKATSIEDSEKENETYEDEKLNKAVERLKSKVESMVGNIEDQLTDVEEKIGDKLHFLDRDMDAIISNEEMAECLQTVLKRELTTEEALAIAADMDENEDGMFTVEELSKWLETNKLVKLVEDGRHAEVDQMIAEQATKAKGEDNEKKES